MARVPAAVVDDACWLIARKTVCKGVSKEGLRNGMAHAVGAHAVGAHAVKAHAVEARTLPRACVNHAPSSQPPIDQATA